MNYIIAAVFIVLLLYCIGELFLPLYEWLKKQIKQKLCDHVTAWGQSAEAWQKEMTSMCFHTPCVKCGKILHKKVKYFK